jgi:hypothetical protein
VFDWLFEGQRMVYVLLAAAAVVCLFVWQQDNRQRWPLTALLALIVLAGFYYALDLMVETDREQITRKITHMAAGVQHRNAEGIFEHISDNFQRFQDSVMNRETFRNLVGRAIDSGRVDEVVVWGFEFPANFRGQLTIERGPSPGTADTARVAFSAKPKGSLTGDVLSYPCEARFVRDPDGQWRLIELQVFNPGSTTLLHIPGFP